MAMESTRSAAEHRHDGDPITSSAVRARAALFSRFAGEEITATRLLVDHLRPPRLFEVASLLEEDDDTEEDIVTSVLRRPATDAASVEDDDPDVIEVVAIEPARLPPPLPAQQERTMFLGTRRVRPAQINMDEEARAELKARLEEVAAAVRRREIDFGATDAERVTTHAPSPPVPPPAPPGGDSQTPLAEGGRPLLPWTDTPPQQRAQQPAMEQRPRRHASRLPTAARKDEEANQLAMAGAAVLLIAGLVIGLSVMRPKTYGSKCPVVCLR